jgi:hypothetical protein
MIRNLDWMVKCAFWRTADSRQIFTHRDPINADCRQESAHRHPINADSRQESAHRHLTSRPVVAEFVDRVNVIAEGPHFK